MSLVVEDIFRFELTQQPDPPEKTDDRRQLDHDPGRQPQTSKCAVIMRTTVRKPCFFADHRFACFLGKRSE